DDVAPTATPAQQAATAPAIEASSAITRSPAADETLAEQLARDIEQFNSDRATQQATFDLGPTPPQAIAAEAEAPAAEQSAGQTAEAVEPVAEQATVEPTTVEPTVVEHASG